MPFNAASTQVARQLAALLLLCALVLSWSALAHAQARRLSWDSLVVHAELDADGRMHVTERHAMRMDGAWNGGERRFRVESRHALQMISLRELAHDGSVREYLPGALNSVGEYAFTDAKTLRWRNRSPSDPAFQNALRVYELRYVLSGTLIQVGSEYLLDHDFAFPDRDGVIHKFSATLQLDQAWQASEPRAHTVELSELAPGDSAIQRVSLHYTRSGRPAAAASRMEAFGVTAPWSLAAGMFASLLLLTAAWALRIVKRERASGHLEPLPDATLVDRAWLAQHVFCHPAEVIGAAWDRQIGPPEVAALLARLTAEGKLHTELIERDSGKDAHELQIALRSDRTQFRGYERALIDGLFFDGDTTDTARIRKHYAARGFDPAALIQPALENEVTGLFGKQSVAKAWPGKVAIGAAMFVAMMLHGTADARPGTVAWTLSCTIMTVLSWSFAGYHASKYRNTVTDAGTRGRKIMFSLGALLFWLAGVYLVFDTGLMIIQLLFIYILTLLAFFHIARTLASRELAVSYRLRRQIAVAREHFAQELELPKPRIEDAWFPYLIAFDLGSDMAQWFRAFGGTQSSQSRESEWTSTSSSSANTSTTSGWSGGGGAFGGAGASGGWAMAVSAVAAGVSAPSSSGGSGSSSSSSSGGGGGGGW